MDRISKTLGSLELRGSGRGCEPFPTQPLAEARCQLCLGAGVVHPRTVEGGVDWSRTQTCLCSLDRVRRELEAGMLQWCGLPAMTEHKTFDRLKTFGESPLEQALQLSRDVAAKSPDVIFLTLLGESDSGKSHLAVAICRDCLGRREAALYASVARMLNTLRQGYDAEGEQSYHVQLRRYATVGLLVLDDFGAEKVTEWGAEQLQSIINERYENGLHTVVTANRPIDDLFNLHDFPRETWRDYANMRVQSRLTRESWSRVVMLDVPAFASRTASSTAKKGG